MKLGRRSFIKKSVLAFFGLMALDALWFEKYMIEWHVFDISRGNSNKIKAIQLSDLHLRELKSHHHSLTQRINEERPDVIFITGDAITRNKYLNMLDEFLGLVDTNIPKIAILGNKEYSGSINLGELRKTYGKNNGVLLVNQCHLLESNNRKINVMGIDDYVFGAPDIVRASEKLDPSMTTVILNHCPVYREQIDTCDMSLKEKPTILSGHTHGGQITFFGIPLTTPYGSGNYVKGWYNNQRSNMYVSKGIGTTNIPIRFGARAEANLFYL